MTRVRVIPPTQVSLNGSVFGPDAIVEAPEEIAVTWMACGYVEPAPAKKAAPRKAPRRATGQ